MKTSQLNNGKTRITDVDRSTGSVILMPGIKPVDNGKTHTIFTKPAKMIWPNEDVRVVAIDAAYNYVNIKRDFKEAMDSDYRKSLLALGIFIGMSILYGIELIIGVF